MADSTSLSSNATESKAHLIKQSRSHEVAIAELNSLSSSRVEHDMGCATKYMILSNHIAVKLRAAILKELPAVYQKNANIYFRTPIQKATASEQKHLDMAKRKLEKLNAA